jgi:hypothetical protein
MAINRGEGAELFSPISITIFGGLLVSTLLTLIIVPSIYSLIDDASVWTRKNYTDKRYKSHTGPCPLFSLYYLLTLNKLKGAPIWQKKF